MKSNGLDRANMLFTPAYLAKLILPLVAEQLLAVTIGFADTVMVAGCGEAAVSGISLVDSISFLIIQLFAAFATGGAVVASQYLGKKAYDSAKIAAKQLIYVSMIISVGMTALLFPFHMSVLKLIFGAVEDQVTFAASAYFKMILLSYPFLAIYSACTALYRSMGKSSITLLVALVMNMLNISGNYIFINIFGMATAGAGLASLISRVVGATIMLVLIHKKRNIIHVSSLLKLEFRWQMIKRILRIGIPSGVENSMFHIGKLLVQRLVAGLGTAAIAANAIIGNIGSIANIPGGAIGLASITVIGQCVGAGDPKQAAYYAKRLIAMVYAACFLISALLFTFRSSLIGVFKLSAEGVAIATPILITLLVAQVAIWPTAFTLPNFLRAAGDAKYTMVVSIFSMWIFRVGCSYVFNIYFGLGLQGVWYAMYADWIARSVFFLIRFVRGGWKQKAVV